MAQKTNSMSLDINVASARGLTEVDPNSKKKLYLYVVVSITGATQNEQVQTHVDKDGGGNPTWNFPVKFAVDLDGLKQFDSKTHLVFALTCEDGKGDRDLGEVHVSINELLQSAGDGNFMRYVAVSYPVQNRSGTSAGVLNFEYRFGDSPAACFATRNIGGYPPQGYYFPPPPPAAAGYYYPPHPHPYGPYPPPSPSHYMPPLPYPPYNVGPSAAPPYVHPYSYYPSHPSHVQARAPPVVQRSVPKKKSGWGSALGVVSALAVGVLSGGSAPSLDFSAVPDVSGLTSGVQIPDPSAYAPLDFSNFYTLPDPSTVSSTFNIDYSSFI